MIENALNMKLNTAAIPTILDVIFLSAEPPTVCESHTINIVEDQMATIESTKGVACQIAEKTYRTSETMRSFTATPTTNRMTPDVKRILEALQRGNAEPRRVALNLLSDSISEIPLRKRRITPMLKTRIMRISGRPSP